MAHTYDTKAQSAVVTIAATISYTCGAIASLLVVGIALRSANVRTGGAPTYNGIALTQAGIRRSTTGMAAELWYLLNPIVSTTANIVVPNTGGYSMRVMASSYIVPTGYHSELDVTGGGAAQVANPSNTVITTVNGDVIVDILSDENNGAETARTQTLLYANDNGAWNNAGSYALQATLGSIAFRHTETIDYYAQCIAAFKQVANPAVNNNVVMMVI